MTTKLISCNLYDRFALKKDWTWSYNDVYGGKFIKTIESGGYHDFEQASALFSSTISAGNNATINAPKLGNGGYTDHDKTLQAGSNNDFVRDTAYTNNANRDFLIANGSVNVENLLNLVVNKKKGSGQFCHPQTQKNILTVAKLT